MSAPYYEDEFVTLFHGDCLVAAEWLTADLLVTDPPYGSEGPSGYGRSAIGKRTIANDQSTKTRNLALLKWAAKPAVVFAHPSLAEPPGEWNYRLVWDKKTPGLGAGAWRWQHEMIYLRGAWAKTAADFSVLRVGRGPQSEARLRHPHEKPQGLMTRLIDGAPAGTIADPFAGSGSTLVAAKQLGRKAIGVELEERYCESAALRLSQHVLDFEGATR